MLTVGAGGFLGALARYGVARALLRRGLDFPWATFSVNLTGAFLLGILLEALVRAGPDNGVRRYLRLLIGTGFLGAFTTYSTFALDTDELLRHGRVGVGIAYLGASVVGGLAAVYAGIALATIGRRRLLTYAPESGLDARGSGS